MAEKTINIIDVTVQKGGFLVHNHLLKEQVSEIAKGLEDAGVEYMELSHGRGIGAKRAGYPAIFPDHELLEAATLAASKLKFLVYASPYAYSLFELEKVKQYCDWIRLSVDLDDLEKGVENLQSIERSGVKAMVLLERAHRVSPKVCAEAAKKLEGNGARIVYLCDTFSSMSASDVQAYLGEIREQSRLPLGFQAFNATGQAAGNSLAALRSGVEWLDASLLGLGLSGGMASYEILVVLLQRLGYPKKWDLQQLCRAGRWHALPAIRRLPSIRHIDLVMSRLKLDYYPLEFLERLAGILEVDLETMLEEIGAQAPERIRLKEADIRSYLQKHGIEFDVVVEFMKT
ncbi:MAG: hypothetical protein K8R69_12495, partial [Deltaproteobacteria bacterium]|nr:hypothetical protein [Deltaproteobacteria bacterium]